MSELDKRLVDICFTASGGISDMAEKEVYAIKQAFIDEGWVNVFDLHNEAGKIQEAQGLDGTWNIDPYNHGLYNGMEMITSIHKNVDPHFREAPSKWIGWGDNV
ncbi:MAG: hypothetical protein EOO27_02295 [Comamonadaceae bacterium]|nr:MAG: hypothetical protein EOO27_02295 [Comamonadaceae bacterium]